MKTQNDVGLKASTVVRWPNKCERRSSVGGLRGQNLVLEVNLATAAALNGCGTTAGYTDADPRCGRQQA